MMMMTRQGYIRANFTNRIRKAALKDKKKFKTTTAWYKARFIPSHLAFKLLHGNNLTWDSLFMLSELLRVDFRLYITNKDTWEELNSKQIDTTEEME